MVGFTFRLTGNEPRNVTELGLWDDHEEDRAVARPTIDIAFR